MLWSILKKTTWTTYCERIKQQSSCTKVSHCTYLPFLAQFLGLIYCLAQCAHSAMYKFFAFVCRNFWAKCKTTLRMSPSEVYPTRKTFPIWEVKLTSLQKHKRVKRIALQKPKEKPSIGKKASLSHQILIHTSASIHVARFLSFQISFAVLFW